MVNDVNTLNGALMELGETMANNLTVMGVQSSASDGLTTLAGKILDIAPSVGGLSLAITVDLYTTPSIIYVGDDFLLRAVVNADYDDTSSSDVDVKGYLQGATVTFKEGSTIIGIARTEADGVATLRIGNVTLGSHNYSAIFDGSGTDYDSANGSLVVNVEHNYSLEFTQEVYVATGGSAIVECVLLDNGSVVVGETVSLTGSDGSLYQSITNQDGVVNFNVSINYETSFTCTYGNANATCTVLRHLYNPVFDGTEETVTLTDGYVFKVENLNGTVWAGNYHQCGRLKEGWDNSTDWVCTMTLQTSYWDGGFVMLLYPYETQTCTQYGNNTWDCIFNNGQNDCLSFCDGQLRVNTGSSWSNVGVTYSRGSTFTAKFVKQGNTLSYYENDNLKGSFTMNKLLTAEKIYIGTLTWGGSGSVNRFKDVVVDKS